MSKLSPPFRDSFVKIGNTKHADKENDESEVRAKHLNHPAGDSVRHQGRRVHGAKAIARAFFTRKTRTCACHFVTREFRAETDGAAICCDLTGLSKVSPVEEKVLQLPGADDQHANWLDVYQDGGE